MVADHGSGTLFWWLALAALVVSAGVVLTTYGWYSALNATVPLLIGLVWIAVFTVACWGAGTVGVRRWLGDGEYGLENLVLVLAVGAFVLTATAALLAALHVLYPFVVMTALALWTCIGALRVYRQRNNHQQPLKLTPRQVVWLLVLLVAAGLGFAAATTMAPFYDQWHYTLGFPYHWLRHGTIVTFPNHAYSFFPANMGLLYTYALAGPGGWAAQLIHWWMASAAALTAAVIARRFGAGSAGQLVAAAVFFATPSVVQLSALAGTDLGIAAFAGAAVISLLKRADAPDQARVWTAWCGVFAGLAAGCKYLALATVVVPLGLLLVLTLLMRPFSSHRGATSVSQLAILALAAGLTIAPWLVRNAISIGNPVHPYFASWFSAGDQVVTPSDDVAREIGSFELSWRSLRDAATLSTFTPRGHAGSLGPVHLLLLPAGLLWLVAHRRRPGALAVGGFIVLSIAAWTAGPTLGRYLLPTLVVTSAVAGAVFSGVMLRLHPPAGGALSFVLATLLLANCNPVLGEHLADQLSCFAGARTTQDYLEEGCTQLQAFSAANRSLPQDAHVLLIGEPRPYGLDRSVSLDGPFETPSLVTLTTSSSSADEMARRLAEHGVTHLLWNSAEAARLARANGREHYLQFASSEESRRFERFLAEHSETVVRGAWWEVRRLRAP